MLTFLLLTGGVIFMFGLIQWARSGVLLWDARQIFRRDISIYEKKSLIRNMETQTDGLLKSSFKLFGALGICVWIFVIATVVMDTNWSNIIVPANRVIGNPAARASFNNDSPARIAAGRYRNSILRSMGAKINR
jgi:hypothetical protein